MSRPLEGKLRSALKRLGCEAVDGICGCRSVASGGRTPGFGAIWRGPWESTGTQRCSEWGWDFAHCSPGARERLMWLLLELLGHQDLAAEMLFQEVGRAQQEEEGEEGSQNQARVSVGTGQGCNQRRRRRDPGKGGRTAVIGPSSARPASSAHYFKPWCYSPCTRGGPVGVGLPGPRAHFSSVPTAR